MENVIACIFVCIGIAVLISIPYLISFVMACRYAETLPESDKEQFWKDYLMELNKHNEGEIL